MSPDVTHPWIRGRYEPIAQIGRGGMAEVVLALFHAGAGGRRLAVLKRIWPELTSDPEFVTMFVDEARLAVRLNHPNVVQTHEVLVAGDELAIAMEYLDGQPLVRLLNRLRRTRDDLPLPLRLRIVAGVLAGLEHAHALTGLDGRALGVVHRDVNPHNVFVTYDGQVKLVDFGVAKTRAASHHTRPGAIKGKIAYMAPEQVRGAKVDRRADLFAVGVMLWELLAGRRIWQGVPEVQIIDHLASARVMPLLPHDPGIPVGLDVVCARALEPDPDLRYQSAAELETDLECVLAGAADSHPRQLGKLLASAFADERAERQELIERCLREDDLTGLAAARLHEAGPRPAPARPPAPAPVPLAATAPTALPPAPAVVAAPVFPWQRTAQMSGLVAASLLGVLVGGWRAEAARHAAERPPEARVDARGPAAPQLAGPPAAAGPPSPGVPGAASAPGLPAPVADRIDRADRSAAGPPREPLPPRRRLRRRAQQDEDATLPPSVDLTAPDPD
jgi:hypothetical protein